MSVLYVYCVSRQYDSPHQRNKNYTFAKVLFDTNLPVIAAMQLIR